MGEGDGTTKYWSRVCAPQLRVRRHDIQETDEQIASYVQEQSGKRTSRPQLNLFLSGRREPYISQLIALCNKFGVDPSGIIRGELLVKGESGRKTHQLGQSAAVLQSKLGISVQRKRSKREYK